MSGSITVNWKYEGYYSRSFDSVQEFARHFDLLDSVDDTATPEQAVEAFHEACDSRHWMIPEALSDDSATDTYWISGEVDMFGVEAVTDGEATQ